MLRILPVPSISSCSKAPGVFSSNCRKPASSPVLYFHRASPRDSSPVVVPFVHVRTYLTRNYARNCYLHVAMQSELYLLFSNCSASRQMPALSHKAKTFGENFE